jgi:Cu-processing system permease protein
MTFSTILFVARDIIREAFASRLMMMLFAAIAAFLLLLTFSLDLEVVDGALASSRLFGKTASDTVVPVDVFLRPAFQALAWVTFYCGLFFGVAVAADIAPRTLQPGRVEMLLALPVRRVELVLGLYVGVCGLGIIATSVATSGVSLVLFAKARMFTLAPLAGAAMAMVGFAAIYAVMLAVGTQVRSAAASAAAGFFLYFLGIAVDEKSWFLQWLSSRTLRTVVDACLTPVPNLQALADLGSGVAVGEHVALSAALPVVGSAVAFAACALAVAAAVVQSKDY